MKKEEDKGDLIIKFNIVFPQKLSESQINTLKAIL